MIQHTVSEPIIFPNNGRRDLADLCGNHAVSKDILHAIEQTRSRGQLRVDGAGRPNFEFHTVADPQLLHDGVDAQTHRRTV